MSNEPLVLAIDDEVALLRLIKLELTGHGFRVITAESGHDGVRMEDEHRPDLVLLDLSMPEMDGFEVMRQLRDRTNVPIILLTAKGSDKDRVRGLELGADDYLPKPFSPSELSARVRAVLRRSMGTQGANAHVDAGHVKLDLNKRTVERDGEPVQLTRTEWLLLQYLAANPGRVMLNAELLSKIWGPEYRGDLQYLRVWVSRLRKKLENDPAKPELIKTFQGIGYMFVLPGQDPTLPTAESIAEAEAAAT
jgi:two-component system KDP operon response regulator KdpE